MAARPEPLTGGETGRLDRPQRNGWPEEIAAVALFLAGDEERHLDRQTLAVNGGLPWTRAFRRAIR